jgi:Polyketide cyclase / dehydrase and lipid transport
LLHLGLYGFTIFVLSPVLLGALVSWVFRPATGARAAGLGALAAMAALSSFLFAGLEGLICVAMAAPLALPLGALGGWLVYRVEVESFRLAAPGAAMLLLLPPASIMWDTEAPPPVFEVRSTVEIAAPPEKVWKHVLTFSRLPEPHEWFFRAGLAYPKRARIEGSGRGAIRYCEFSTGPFVEPIEVWNEPRVRFHVTENPVPMQEWSPYAQVLPKHLHGYMIAKQGQFELTPLANKRTLLEGTTWYQHGLWPAEYWRWWSDAIIHRIHLRVLTHIRTLAEKGGYDNVRPSRLK